MTTISKQLLQYHFEKGVEINLVASADSSSSSSSEICVYCGSIVNDVRRYVSLIIDWTGKKWIYFYTRRKTLYLDVYKRYFFFNGLEITSQTKNAFVRSHTRTHARTNTQTHSHTYTYVLWLHRKRCTKVCLFNNWLNGKKMIYFYTRP